MHWLAYDDRHDNIAEATELKQVGGGEAARDTTAESTEPGLVSGPNADTGEVKEGGGDRVALLPPTAGEDSTAETSEPEYVAETTEPGLKAETTEPEEVGGSEAVTEPGAVGGGEVTTEAEEVGGGEAAMLSPGSLEGAETAEPEQEQCEGGAGEEEASGDPTSKALYQGVC